MKTLTKTLQRIRQQLAANHCDKPLPLVRRFVETGDERCPLGGIWLTLSPSADDADDPELSLAAMRRLLSWRPFHRPLIYASYSHL